MFVISHLPVAGSNWFWGIPLKEPRQSAAALNLDHHAAFAVISEFVVTPFGGVETVVDGGVGSWGNAGGVRFAGSAEI
jgi:hypothetical protein